MIENYMQSKISLKQSSFIVSILGIVFFQSLFFLPTDSKSKDSFQSSSYSQQIKIARAALPVRLKIPKIHVDAAVEYVGLTPAGAMDVPKNPVTVAWLNLGARPGEVGSAVVSGHYGWKNGKPAAFDNLYALRKGDKIYIEDEKGATTTFVVREIRRYSPSANAAEVFASSDGKAHLNLITCEGVWNKVEKSYSKRLVVFTDKLDSQSSP